MTCYASPSFGAHVMKCCLFFFGRVSDAHQLSSCWTFSVIICTPCMTISTRVPKKTPSQSLVCLAKESSSHAQCPLRHILRRFRHNCHMHLTCQNKHFRNKEHMVDKPNNALCAVADCLADWLNTLHATKCTGSSASFGAPASLKTWNGPPYGLPSGPPFWSERAPLGSLEGRNFDAGPPVRAPFHLFGPVFWRSTKHQSVKPTKNHKEKNTL